MSQAPGARTPPSVSTVIPCFNGERYLGEAIRSVLDQDHDPLEIIVVDDGSTDRSAQVACGFGERVRLVAQPHAGAAAARNLGVQHAQGDVLAFLDADDLWTAGRLVRQLRVLESHASADIVIGHTEQFVSPEIAEPERLAFRFDPGPAPARLSGALVVRRPAFERVGGFSTALETGEFVDWYLRAEELGLVSVMLPEVVLRRRLHRGNHGVVRRDAQQDYLSVIRAALERRRRAERTS